MALKDLLSLIDDKLEEVFHSKPHDPVKARKPVLDGIERTRTQFLATEPSKAPNKWWKISNSVVAFTPKVGGDVLTINGKETNYIPSERFPDFLNAFKAEVEAGAFDKELENHGKGSAKVSASGGKSTGTRNTGPQSSLNIAIAAKRRAANPPSFEDLRKEYVGKGHDAAMVDIAIKKRQGAEKNAK